MTGDDAVAAGTTVTADPADAPMPEDFLVGFDDAVPLTPSEQHFADQDEPA